MFSLIPANHPPNTTPQILSETQCAFEVAYHPASPFTHLVIFINPGNTLPAGTAASVFIQMPWDADFAFHGAVANEKPSAVFKVRAPAAGGIVGEGVVRVGISVETLAEVEGRMAGIQSAKQQQQNGAAGGAGVSHEQTKELAKRIIKSAYDYLGGFSEMINGVEAVPIKKFEEWWRKFEGKVERDPGFLDRVGAT